VFLAFRVVVLQYKDQSSLVVFFLSSVLGTSESLSGRLAVKKMSFNFKGVTLIIFFFSIRWGNLLALDVYFCRPLQTVSFFIQEDLGI